MSDEIVAALIAVGGVIASILVTLLIDWLKTSFNYKDLYARTVSGNRTEWINVWRENVALFLANAETLQRCYHDKKDFPKDNPDAALLYRDMIKARTMVTSRLNASEENHVLMFRALKNFEWNTDWENFVTQREFIENLTRQILKPEWERVKDEAKGKHN